MFQQRLRSGFAGAWQREAIRASLSEKSRYFFPRLDGGEMWSRWDMQETPPDVLITNYSMLNIMLMRQLESPIFEKTRAWLAGGPPTERAFFLVVDELHSYRGTPGTEVAYVLRLLLQRLGLTPDSPQLKILATSASIDESHQDRSFLREFFGRDRFELVGSKQVTQVDGSTTNFDLLGDGLAHFASTVAPDDSNLESWHEPERETLLKAYDVVVSSITRANPTLAQRSVYETLGAVGPGMQ